MIGRCVALRWGDDLTGSECSSLELGLCASPPPRELAREAEELNVALGTLGLGQETAEPQAAGAAAWPSIFDSMPELAALRPLKPPGVAQQIPSRVARLVKSGVTKDVAAELFALSLRWAWIESGGACACTAIASIMVDCRVCTDSRSPPCPRIAEWRSRSGPMPARPTDGCGGTAAPCEPA